MAKETTTIPFAEYDSTLSRYSDNNQLQAHQYKSILESQLGQALYQREFPTIGDAALGPLNANVPRLNKSSTITIKKEPVNVYKEFWQYKQPAGTIFTDWNSAGVSAIKEDISVRDLPLYGHINDPNLVLSNTNNVRNNFQNYGKEYLTTTNMLNSEAFKNGVSYESSATSPYRTGTKYELQQIEHGNFRNKENGDIYSRQVKQLRVDLPINYANNSISSWSYINVAFIKPNDHNGQLKVFHETLKYGTFDLDSMKLTGSSCLTKNFGMTPEEFSNPVDVYNDDFNYPPVLNSQYYTKGRYYHKKEGILDGSNLFCSANSNYITMPKNHLHEKLDTSFQISPGNNSLTLGTVMSTKLKNFINVDLHKFNRDLIMIQLYRQFVEQNDPYMTGLIEHKFPHLFPKHAHDEMYINARYNGLSEDEKYKRVFNMQRNFASINQGHPEVEIFINHLSIFKLGSHNVNYPGINAKVEMSDLSNDGKIESYDILKNGCYLLLPTMLSEDLFSVRQEIPGGYTNLMNNSDNGGNGGNNCITGDYEENATNCAFRDKASMWQQKPEAGLRQPNFIPNMFNDPHNFNNDIYNLDNLYAGANPYNAPSTF